MKWIIRPNLEPEEHWVNVVKQEKDNDDGSDGSEGYWSQAALKWDGCIDLNIAGNIPFSEADGWCDRGKILTNGSCDDYIHICNLDEFIKDLIALREFGRNYFKDKEDWK